MSEENSNPKSPVNYDTLRKIISGAWKPAREKTDLIRHSEVMEYISELSDATPEEVYTSMIDLEFSYKNIENVLYWMVEEE